MNEFHVPVLLAEVIENLKVAIDKKYIDATIGGGGHALEIVKHGGVVLGIDQDQEALDQVITVIPETYRDKIKLVNGNFTNLQSIARKNNFCRVSGILFDLGVSSHQLGKPSRGFSFKTPGPIDMRMDQQQKSSAFEFINYGSQNEIVNALIKYGEEPLAFEISTKIVKTRGKGKITQTDQLSQLVKEVYREKRKQTSIHPATRTFQAIRIWVNQELEVLKSGLDQALNLLDKNGRLLVISYHSLEDRITKLLFNKAHLTDKFKIITRKPILASFEEIRINHRARSAKLRVIEKL